MPDLRTLFETIDHLSDDELKQVISYIHAKQIEGHLTPQSTPRILGLHAHLGKAWMSDDILRGKGHAKK